MALLELTGITVRFGAVTALDGVSFAVDAGTVSALVGRNGAGKSTLLDVVTGLRAPAAGTVRFDGRDVTGDPPSRRALAGMARTFEQPRVFGSLTVRDNVLAGDELRGGLRGLLPASLTRHGVLRGGFLRAGLPRGGAPHRRENHGREQHERVDELLQRLGIDRYAAQLAGAVPAEVARLVEVARALAARPRLLVLDEPSAGLDEEQAGSLAALLRELAEQGAAVLLAEPGPGPVTSTCDTVHPIELGRLAVAETAEVSS